MISWKPLFVSPYSCLIEIEIEIIFTYLLLKLCAIRYTFFHLRMI